MARLSVEEARLWHAWKQATHTVRTRVGDEIARATGLSDPEFGILSRLVDIGGGSMRQSELADSMAWHRSRLSHQLTRMEDRGLIIREASTAPGVSVSLTKAGAAAISAARPVHADAVRRYLVDAISVDEMTRVTALLEALAAPCER